MNALVLFIGWCILFALYWPLAVLALVLIPFVWLALLPFRLLLLCVRGLFALLRALVFLPARLVGHPPAKL